MNTNLTARDFSNYQREAEAKHRAERLRRDWHTREAIRVYIATHLVAGLLHNPGIEHTLSSEQAAELLKPYAYLNNVPKADFRWFEAPAVAG